MQSVPEEPESKITFTPSRVDWIMEVHSVTVRPIGLELETADGKKEIRFNKIGRLQESRFMRILKQLGGFRPTAMLVADRDWFHPPQERFFRFYTDRPLTMYMPASDSLDYLESVFFRAQVVIRRGGYETFDLG